MTPELYLHALNAHQSAEVLLGAFTEALTPPAAPAPQVTCGSDNNVNVDLGFDPQPDEAVDVEFTAGNLTDTQQTRVFQRTGVVATLGGGWGTLQIQVRRVRLIDGANDAQHQLPSEWSDAVTVTEPTP